ncbi:MAG: phosphoribosyltransferase family protein [Thermomicrobiales bacterium]
MREAILLGPADDNAARQPFDSAGHAPLALPAFAAQSGATQQMLPPLRWLMQPDASRFAHPAESQLAHMLSFYGVRWSYEPTTFAVRWGPEGEPLQFVTPDFYLPDYDCYLELTTMRQRLVTRKNRKFRMLREAYPNVSVRILYQKDFERLQRVLDAPRTRPLAALGGPVFDAGQLRERISILAADYVDLWASKSTEERAVRPLLLGLGRGSRTFLDALGAEVRAHGVSVDQDRIELSHPGAPGTRRRARVERSPQAAIDHRPVLLVQEVLSSGLSAAYVTAWLQRHGAASVEICTLLDRDVARVLDVPVALRGFSAPDVALAGFGLSRWREFRDLPYVAAVEAAPA